MFLLFFFLSCWVRDFAFFKIQEILIQEVWELVLSLKFLKQLVLKISNWQNLRFNTFREIILKIPNKRDLRLDYGNMSETIILWIILIYLSENKGRLKIINFFFWLMCPNCLVFYYIILSRPWLKADIFFKRIILSLTFLELCHY